MIGPLPLPWIDGRGLAEPQPDRRNLKPWRHSGHKGGGTSLSGARGALTVTRFGTGTIHRGRYLSTSGNLATGGITRNPSPPRAWSTPRPSRPPASSSSSGRQDPPWPDRAAASPARRVPIAVHRGRGTGAGCDRLTAPNRIGSGFLLALLRAVTELRRQGVIKTPPVQRLTGDQTIPASTAAMPG